MQQQDKFRMIRACLPVLVFALHARCSSFAEAEYVNDSKSLMTSLGDERISDIVFTGNIILDEDWSTVVLANRTVKIYGTGYALNFNGVSEAIVVEEDADVEWHALTLLQSADSEQAVPGNFSRYRMVSLRQWPSFVILPGGKVLYNHTVSVTKDQRPFSAVAAGFAAVGIGEHFIVVNRTAFSLTGFHEFVNKVVDITDSTTVGSAILCSNEVTVVGNPSDATLSDTENGHPARLNWRQGMLIGIAVGVTIVIIANSLCLACYIKSGRKGRERTYSRHVDILKEQI